MGSSQIRGRTHVPCTGWWNLNHEATRESETIVKWCHPVAYVEFTVQPRPPSQTSHSCACVQANWTAPPWMPVTSLGSKMPFALLFQTCSSHSPPQLNQEQPHHPLAQTKVLEPSLTPLFLYPPRLLWAEVPLAPSVTYMQKLTTPVCPPLHSCRSLAPLLSPSSPFILVSTQHLSQIRSPALESLSLTLSSLGVMALQCPSPRPR